MELNWIDTITIDKVEWLIDFRPMLPKTIISVHKPEL